MQHEAATEANSAYRFTSLIVLIHWFLTKGKTFSQSADVLKCLSTEIKSSKEALSVLMLCMSIVTVGDHFCIIQKWPI